MKMIFVKAICAVVLATSLTAVAGPKPTSKKQARKTANSECAPINKPIQLDEVEYTATNLNFLRNSIYAQYGFKFKNKEIENQMVEKGCFKDVPYNYTNLTTIDKKNIKTLKSAEAELRDMGSYDFEKEWKRTTSARERSKMLDGKFCYLNGAEGEFMGLIHFARKKSGGDYALTGLLDFSKAKYTHPEGDGDEEVLDSTVAQSLDSTSMHGVELTTKGTWSVNNDKLAANSVKVTIDKVKNKTINIDSTYFTDRNVLGCTVVK